MNTSLKLRDRASSSARGTMIAAAVLTASVGGCAMSEDEQPTLDEESLLQADVETRAVLSFGYTEGDGSVLETIGSAVEIVSAPVTSGEMTPELAREALEGADAVAVDLAMVDPSEFDGWSPILRAAHEAEMPILIEHADPELVSKAIGVGVEGDVLYVKRDGNNTMVSIFTETEAPVMSEDGEELGTETIELDVEMVAQDIGQRLFDQGRATHLKAPGAEVLSSSNRVHYYDIDFPSYTRTYNGQVMTWNQDFRIEVVADQIAQQKYARIREAGGGFHPGALWQNWDHHRGWYTKWYNMEIFPTSNMSLWNHQPETTTQATTYTSSTGYTATMNSAGLMTLGFSSDNKEATTLSDFHTTNNTAGNDAKWNWYYTTPWNNLYYHPFLKRCRIHSLPHKTTSNLTPRFEAVYRWNSAGDPAAHFLIRQQVRVQNVTAGGPVFNCHKGMTPAEWSLSQSIWIDFNTVSF